MVRISSYISEDIYNSLRKISKAQERSRNFLVSKALEKYIMEINQEVNFENRKSA